MVCEPYTSQQGAQRIECVQSIAYIGFATKNKINGLEN